MCERRTLLWRDVREDAQMGDYQKDAQARVMEKLITLHYVDDSRYTESFVHDKSAITNGDDGRLNRLCG